MDVSSSGSAPISAPIEAQKKAIEVQEQQVLKVLESANQQSQQMSAQKTGIGQHVNIKG